MWIKNRWESDTMNLEQLIEILETKDPNIILRRGFNNPHSYRGYYEQLAFEIVEDISIGDMLECAKDALNNIYEGYKGGSYTMDKYTSVHLSNIGETGNELSEMLLQCMINNEVT